MKTSTLFLSFAFLVLLIVPALHKWSMWSRYQHKNWTHHSSRTKKQMNEVDTISLHNLSNFRYHFHADSEYLEYNKQQEHKFNIEVDTNTLKITPAKKARPETYYGLTTPIDFIIDFLNGFDGQVTLLTAANFGKGTDRIVYYGPKCPVILAQNSTFNIDQAGDNTSFELHLDFSTFYWNNFKVTEDGAFDKKVSVPWNLNELNLYMIQSNYFMPAKIGFKNSFITAGKQSTLEIGEDKLDHVQLRLDSTTLIKAPYSLWAKIIQE